jgi:hypothetical protein
MLELSEPFMEPHEPGTVRCPTCRATQPWSNECRRCKSDLRLLRAAHEAYGHARRQCLQALRGGLPHQALQLARYCAFLRQDEESRRLVALCALCAGDWSTAYSQALLSLEDPKANPIE